MDNKTTTNHCDHRTKTTHPFNIYESIVVSWFHRNFPNFSEFLQNMNPNPCISPLDRMTNIHLFTNLHLLLISQTNCHFPWKLSIVRACPLVWQLFVCILVVNRFFFCYLYRWNREKIQENGTILLWLCFTKSHFNRGNKMLTKINEKALMKSHIIVLVLFDAAATHRYSIFTTHCILRTQFQEQL